MPRRALLLAIAKYDSGHDLDYVANDIPRLRPALHSAGYDPSNIAASGVGVGADDQELTSTRLRRLIREFLKTADPIDDCFIYFSGHGLEFNNQRTLLPVDFNLDDVEGVQASIHDGWIEREARVSPANSVLVLIDACREGARFAIAADKSISPSGARPLIDEYDRQGPESPTIAFVYSCERGATSGIDRQDRACSAFTRAISQVMESETNEGVLDRLLASLQYALDAASDGQQTLVATGTDGRGGPWRDLLVKEDVGARFRARLEHSRWCKLLEATELFQQVEAHDPAYAMQLRSIAMRAQDQVAAAAEALPMQRWRDPVAWHRLLRRLYAILLAPGKHTVSPAEAAVLLAVPFVYETVLAEIELQLARAGALPDPDAKPQEPGSPLTAAWRTAWRESPAGRNRRSLLARNLPDAADDHACWHLLTFSHRAGELWDWQSEPGQRRGWARRAVDKLVEPSPLPDVGPTSLACALLEAPRLLRLARLMFASFEDLTQAETGADIQDRLNRVLVGAGPSSVTINETRLAYLLNVASRLALDARRMPAVMAEHIGSDAALSSTWVKEQLQRAEWRDRPQTGGIIQFDLHLDCPNEAVDAALLEVVGELDSVRTRLSQRQDWQADEMSGLLPDGFTADYLNTNRSGWQPTRPPLRFELDRSRIIELLMGQQLYGESWPALRELYQNALDACRYRRAQEALASKDGRLPSGLPYLGQIEFRFGKTKTGRRYVECVDDGIGMDERHLRRLFSRAGQSFADSHEFHIDQSRWDEAGIPFYRNSRFGIGVLSYFMLAEELDIFSQRFYLTGERPSQWVRARVLGTGNLFRLTGEPEPARLLDRNGTALRLYLREDAQEDDDLVQRILSWLYLPEVPVTIRRAGIEPMKFKAAEPTNAFLEASGGALLPLQSTAGSTGAPRIFLAPKIRRTRPGETGIVLVDGIRTKVTDTQDPLWPEIGHGQPYRNLRGCHFGRPADHYPSARNDLRHPPNPFR